VAKLKFWAPTTVGNLQPSVGKLQLPVPLTFSTDDATGPLINPARGPAVSSPVGSGANPDRKRIFIHFKLENRVWWWRFWQFLCKISWFRLTGGFIKPIEPPLATSLSHLAVANDCLERVVSKIHFWPSIYLNIIVPELLLEMALAVEWILAGAGPVAMDKISRLKTNMHYDAYILAMCWL